MMYIAEPAARDIGRCFSIKDKTLYEIVDGNLVLCSERVVDEFIDLLLGAVPLVKTNGQVPGT